MADKLKVLELFGGIGAMTQALKRVGVPFEIADYVEIDKYAVASYNAINDTNFEPQDITKWNKDIAVDLIMHGSPCQDFSVSGKGAGGDKGSGTRSSLMYETIRIVEKLKPKYVIWENVKNLISKKHKHNFDAYIDKLAQLGYESYYKVLNAKDYGIPQNRERVFTISVLGGGNYSFPPKQELEIKLKDLLEKDVDESFFLSSKQVERITYDKNYTGDKLKIKNNTKKGYLEAKQGDGIYINIGNKRGCVQDQSIATLTSQNDKGVVVENLKTKLCNKLVQEGKVAEGDVIKHSFTQQILDGKKKCVEKSNGVMITLTTRGDCTGVAVDVPPLRIRKLTPKECWRLMGFNDTAFEKAEKVCSKAQLYKQAGNSIVVNVLVEIIKNLGVS